MEARTPHRAVERGGSPGPGGRRLRLATAARRLRVPAELLVDLCEDGLIAGLGRSGGYYYFDAAELPGRDEVIDLARQRYERILERIGLIAGKLIAEIEAVQYDARDALEHATDPVGRLGPDLVDLVGETSESTRTIAALMRQLRANASNAIDANRELGTARVGGATARAAVPAEGSVAGLR